MKKILLLCISAILLAACSNADPTTTSTTEVSIAPLSTTTLSNTSTVEDKPTTTPTPKPTMEKVQPDWVDSPHALAKNIVECESCHLSDNGNLTTKLAIINKKTGDQEPIFDKSALCSTCHDGYKHSESPHDGFSCLNCHDPHSTVAACETCHDTSGETSIIAVATPADGHHNGEDSLCFGAGCHISATQAAQTPPTAHPAKHPLVTCAACHDATSAPVGPHESDPMWVDMKYNEADESAPFTSHTLQKKVDCQRCHFIDNPWGLSEHASDEKLDQ